MTNDDVNDAIRCNALRLQLRATRSAAASTETDSTRWLAKNRAIY